MQSLSQSELCKLQLVLLDMLVELDRICKKYNIRYCIIAGTLLGAVRHKGFIPWDDDLDVAMTRDEYERFREVCKTELETSRYFFQDNTTDPHYPWGYGRLRRVNSEFVRVGQEHLKMRTGIFLDVFPIDGVPDFPPLRGLFTAYCFALRKVLYSRVGAVSEKNIFKRAIYRIMNKIPLTWIFRRLGELQNYGRTRETKYARILTFPTPKGRPYGYLRKWYVELSKINFEGRIFPGIRDYDAYLTYKFGDYMVLPPPEQRHWHPVSKFSLPEERIEEWQNMTNTPNHRWIYTYDYAPEQVWEPWRESDEIPGWIAPESERVAKRVAEHKSAESLMFALLTDSHYVINGTWQDTQAAIEQLNNSLKLDGAIHLGDFTDGMVSRKLTHEYVTKVISSFEKIGLNVYAALGNHDCNYFKNNPDRMSVDEQCKLYLKRESPRYFVDYEQHKLRLIFIDSYDVSEQLRYGFSPECINWLDSILSETLSGWSVIVFSHLTPLVKLQSWAKDIRNSEGIMTALNKHSSKILAFISGHNHCDHLYNEGQFPIISINCAKCEYFLEHKPEGAVVPYRKLGEITQESFDIMTIDAKNKTIRFTRFGAGDDRIVENGKAGWL